MEATIRRSLTPLPDRQLPLLREIDAAADALNGREATHLARFRSSMIAERDEADEYLRHHGLIPTLYEELRETLNEAKIGNPSADFAVFAAEKIAGEAAIILIDGMAEALRHPEVLDRLAQWRVAVRSIRVLDEPGSTVER